MLNKCHSCFVILTKFVIDQFLREHPKQSGIKLAKLNFSLWLVQKTRTKFSTNQMQNYKQSHLGQSCFPAFQAVWVLIDPWPYKLWLWVVVRNAKWLWFFNTLSKTAVSHAFNPLNPMGDQNIISSYNINTISTR